MSPLLWSLLGLLWTISCYKEPECPYEGTTLQFADSLAECIDQADSSLRPEHLVRCVGSLMSPSQYSEMLVYFENFQQNFKGSYLDRNLYKQCSKEFNK